MVYAHNLIISRNNGRRKTISTMVNDRQRLQTIEKTNQQSTSFCLQMKRHFVRWRWSHLRAPGPSREIVQGNSHSATGKTNEYHDKASKSTQKWLDNDRQQRQTTASNQQSTIFCRYFRWWETRLCKFHRRSCSTRGEIVLESLHANRTRLTKLTVLQWVY